MKSNTIKAELIVSSKRTVKDIVRCYKHKTIKKYKAYLYVSSILIRSVCNTFRNTIITIGLNIEHITKYVD